MQSNISYGSIDRVVEVMSTTIRIRILVIVMHIGVAITLYF